jgi:hypothetical protein
MKAISSGEATVPEMLSALKKIDKSGMSEASISPHHFIVFAFIGPKTNFSQIFTFFHLKIRLSIIFV